MNVYTYSEARRNLASLLDEVKQEGEVRITRRDGSTCTLKPTPKGSPFDDVEPVSGTGVTRAELSAWIREGRERKSSPRTRSDDSASRFHFGLARKEATNGWVGLSLP